MEWRETTTCWENEVPVIEEINDRSFDVIESLLQVAQEGGSEWYEAIVSHAKASEQDDQEIDLTNEQKLLLTAESYSTQQTSKVTKLLHLASYKVG